MGGRKEGRRRKCREEGRGRGRTSRRHPSLSPLQ